MAEREAVLRHKWFQSEKAGRDIGFEKALFSWMLYHRSLWLESRRDLVRKLCIVAVQSRHCGVDVFRSSFHSPFHMSSGKNRKLAHKSALLQQAVVHELQSLVKTIERGETLLAELKAETEAMNVKHQDRKTTRDDIAYLEDLLKCAKKKLAWEKQMEAVAKRTPVTLAQVSSVMNDAINPPDESTRETVLELLKTVQMAMNRLEVAKAT